MLTCNYEFEIEKSKDGYDVIKVKKDSRNVYIGSKYNMKNEIDKFMKISMENINNEGKEVFIIYGFGNGEHVRELRKVFKENNIVIFEPNINLYNYAVDLQFIKNDKALKVVCCEEIRFYDEFNFAVSETNINRVKINCFSNYSSIYNDEFKEFLGSFGFYINSVLTNKYTILKYSKVWFDSLLKNIPYILESTPIYEYSDKYKNKPAVIVSAGPSLDKNIKELKDAHGKMLILSSTRTLSSIMDLEISPDLLVAIDPTEEIYKLMEECNNVYNGPLLFYERTNHSVIKNHKGDRIFYTSSKFIHDIMDNKMVQISDGGSVAITMVDFAIFAGCNPIIFIGQDLAFKEDKIYADVSEHKSVNDGNSEYKLQKDIYVEGVNGDMVKTIDLFNLFRLNIEKLIVKNPEIEFINATEGGARIKGTKEMPFKDAVNKYAISKIEPIESAKIDLDVYKKTINQLKKALKVSGNIMNCCNGCLLNLDKLEKAYRKKDYKKVNELLKTLDKADKYIEDNYKDVELIESLLSPLMFSILDDSNGDSKDGKMNEIDEILEQSNKLYNGFLDSINYAINAISDLILELENKYDK